MCWKFAKVLMIYPHFSYNNLIRKKYSLMQHNNNLILRSSSFGSSDSLTPLQKIFDDSCGIRFQFVLVGIRRFLIFHTCCIEFAPAYIGGHIRALIPTLDRQPCGV